MLTPQMTQTEVVGQVLRQCDEAVEAERMLDERIRQKANENDNDNEKEV